MTWQPPRESEFHAPTKLCPHPEYWTAWNNVSTEVEVSMLVAALVRAMQPENVLEIGAHYGQTTERIGQVLRENGHGHLIALDIDPCMIGSAAGRCQQYLDREVELITVDSLAYIPDKPVDFLFIDGNDRRSLDLNHYLPYLDLACMVVVHDTDYYIDETQAILALWPWQSMRLHTPRGLTILVRP